MFQEPQLFAQSGGESTGGSYVSENYTSGEESFASEVQEYFTFIHQICLIACACCTHTAISIKVVFPKV